MLSAKLEMRQSECKRGIWKWPRLTPRASRTPYFRESHPPAQRRELSAYLAGVSAGGASPSNCLTAFAASVVSVRAGASLHPCDFPIRPDDDRVGDAIHSILPGDALLSVHGNIELPISRFQKALHQIGGFALINADEFHAIFGKC